MVLDALVKGIYYACGDFTDIYELFEDWTITIFEQFVGLNVERLAPGKHYWCGTAACPGPECQLTYPCRIRRRDNEARWRQERPMFWEYLRQTRPGGP